MTSNYPEIATSNNIEKTAQMFEDVNWQQDKHKVLREGE